MMPQVSAQPVTYANPPGGRGAPAPPVPPPGSMPPPGFPMPPMMGIFLLNFIPCIRKFQLTIDFYLGGRFGPIFYFVHLA